MPAIVRLLVLVAGLAGLAFVALRLARGDASPWSGDMTPPTAAAAPTVPPPPAEPKGLQRATFSLG